MNFGKHHREAIVSNKKYDPLTLLFVEDEERTRARVTTVLARRVTNLLVAENGEKGLVLYNKYKPDVLLTDLNLPDISGLSLISKIRENDPKLEIVIITAHNESDYLLEAIEQGVSNFLIKPLDIFKLDQALDKIFHKLMMEEEIEMQRSYTRKVLDFQESLVIVTDGTNIIDANERFKQFFELKNEQLQELTLESIFAELEGAPAFHLFTEDDWKVESHEVSKVIIYDGHSGMNRYFKIKTELFPDQQHLKIISLTDVTELEHESQYYQQLAIIDPLTQIYNRVQFNRSMAEEIQKSIRFNSTFAIVMFDIDYFKWINDNFGHQTGDKILIEITEVVTLNIREIDTFARFGGEEFIILAPETDLDGAMTLAEKLRKEIEENSFSHGKKLTCSFGVSVYQKNDKPDDLIKRVDDRLYLAKKRGRNQVCSRIID
jgi:two-component system, cell cycle response regulator